MSIIVAWFPVAVKCSKFHEARNQASTTLSNYVAGLLTDIRVEPSPYPCLII